MSIDSVPAAWDTVRLRVWRGTVPIAIRREGTTEQLKLDVPRLSYLPLAFEKVRDWLCQVDKSCTTENIWLVVDNAFRPRLLTHMPVGLLYDLHIASPGSTLQLLVADDVPDSALKSQPGSWPAPTYMNVQTREAMTELLWQAYKQSLLLRLGTLRPLQSQSPQQSASLKESLVMLDMNMVSELTQRMLDQQAHAVPVRICLSPEIFLQVAAALRTDGHATTVQDCILARMPEFESLLVDPTCDATADGVHVISHGVPVSLDASLLDLLEEAAYADGWLYVSFCAAG
jgi:hypothetical protein